jgi:hypothetical protein
MCLYLSCRPVLIRLSSARGFRTSGDPEVTDKGINGICIQAGGNSSTGYDCPGWIKATWQGANPGGVGGGKWGTPYQWRSAGAPPVKEDYIHSPSRTPGNGSGFPFTTDFPTWQLGSGGPAAGVYDPPGSFWGLNKPDAGAQWNWLTSISYSAVAQVPLDTLEPIDIHNPPIVQGFHGGHWGGWSFAVNSTVRGEKGGVSLVFSKGGFQEARGFTKGAESFVENARSLLDAGREWYGDFNTGRLYYHANGTTAPPSNGWVSSHLETVLHINGTQDVPVVGHQLIGVRIEHTAPVFMKQYQGSLSGGDWAIRPTGAVMLTGVRDAVVRFCTFSGVGGNGLFIGDFARNTIVAENEFAWVGESAIASIGSTDRIDGTNGNQPRGNAIVKNLIREIGIFGKQTAGYVQGMTAQTVVKKNILFNGPRAGICFLDGFGGGSIVTQNLAFNFVRETGDHGKLHPTLCELVNLLQMSDHSKLETSCWSACRERAI